MNTSIHDDDAAISARGLYKAFGEKVVLDGIDLTVRQGTILALLGPNGAGKTTAVHLLTTYLRPDAGEIRVAGRDTAKNPQAVRRAIGVTGQFSAVDGYLTGRENLMLMADLHLQPKRVGRRKAEELLERFELGEAGDKPASTYSGGMKRKLDLAMTLVGDPKVIFLDEPTTGLDPRSRRTMWDIIRGLVASGTTLLLTTQYLEEADQLADRVAVLDGGRIVAEGTPAELKARIPGGHIQLSFADRAQLDAATRVLGPAGGRDDDGLTLQLPGDARVSTLWPLLQRLNDASVEVEALTVHTPDLDDVFFALTGRTEA
ncbi:daunorubicin resistance protein DrrA family ABC transporter ATP-binding protein [Streptacidiphilus neutrinimicus]|uniref:daunorubicin resistance protein DrrA family ABC transporter ATP-binding protein n=1 Tax=Streptacidiphilus neutrinimicus TaxID=105420 RepID=UPI0005AA0513|nr:daunorubicin resistance protein DrrA family ABC transporter ATP-binding protein [Streptacidiphilus neutrinimicus]